VTDAEKLEKLLKSIQGKIDDARDKWVETQDVWAFRYFNDMPLVVDALKNATENRGRKKSA